MIGRRISHLRERVGLTRSELAEATGLSEYGLAIIEDSNAVSLPVEQLLTIAGGLELKRAEDFARLMKLNGRKRRIHVFITGLAKTGTVSMTGIFSRFVTQHEFMQWNTHQAVIGYRSGKISRDEFRAFLRERDDLGGMEVDSAHFNRHYIDISSEDYPEAHFICLIRDPFSWVSSLINYFVVPEREAIQSDLLPNGMPFDIPRGDIDAKKRLIADFPVYAEKPIRFWAEEYRRIISLLPEGRSIILLTHEISRSLERISRFLCIPVDDLCHDRTHMNKAVYTTDVLRQCDSSHLAMLFGRHCSDLLEQFFPGYTLHDYLAGGKPK